MLLSIRKPWIAPFPSLGSLGWMNSYSRFSRSKHSGNLAFKNQYRYHRSREKCHTYDLDVPRSILISIEYFKFVNDLINSTIIHLMTPS